MHSTLILLWTYILIWAACVAAQIPTLSVQTVELFATQNGFGFLESGDLNSMMDLGSLLTVSYDQPAGSYDYCEATISNEAVEFTLQPGVATPEHTPWELRSGRSPYSSSDFNSYVPSVTFDGETNKLYALVVMDPLQMQNQGDLAFLHALYFNLDENSVASASGFQVPYLGPGNPSTTIAHQYEFILFEQNSEVTISDSSAYAVELSSRLNFNLTRLVDEANLGSIFAINWVFTYNDLFADVELAALDFGSIDCSKPALVQYYAADNDFGFLESGDLNSIMELTTLLTVSFDQPAGTFEYCGTEISGSAVSISLEPQASFGPQHTPWEMRSARPEYTAADFTAYCPSVTFTSEGNDMYTLVVMDPLQKVDQGDLAYLHAFYPNIQYGDISTSNGFQIPYIGPGNPSSTVAHIYEFILFEQSSTVDVTDTYATFLTGRENFNLTEMKETLNLGSICGINWAQVYNDEWANYELFTFGLISELPCGDYTSGTQGTDTVGIAVGVTIGVVVVVAVIVFAVLYSRKMLKKTRTAGDVKYGDIEQL